MGMKPKSVFTLDESAEIIKIFNLSNPEVQNQISESLEGNDYSYHFYIQFALDYLVNIANETNPQTLYTCIFRYTVLLMYVAFRHNLISELKSKALDGLLKNELTANVLRSKIDTVVENDMWSNVYNECKYNNEFGKIVNNQSKKYSKKEIKQQAKFIEKLQSAFYKQESYFLGEAPLFGAIDTQKSGFYRFDEFICDALSKRDNFVFKKQFTIDYTSENECLNKWRDKLLDGKQKGGDLQILSFVLKEAICQNKMKRGDFVEVETQNYYRAVMHIKGGYYCNISFINYDRTKGTVMFNYDLFAEPLEFKCNNESFIVSENGITKKAEPI